MRANSTNVAQASTVDGCGSDDRGTRVKHYEDYKCVRLQGPDDKEEKE